MKAINQAMTATQIWTYSDQAVVICVIHGHSAVRWVVLIRLRVSE